jgi:hypothetical protein
MSEVTRIEGINGRNGTFEPSPINYFPNDPNMVATRLTIYNFDDPVFFHDFIVHNNTLYALYIEAMPDYRDGKWVNYIDFKGGPAFDQAMALYGVYEREVFLNITPHSSQSVLAAIEKRKDLTEQDIMVATKLFLNGTVMEVIDTGEPSI